MRALTADHMATVTAFGAEQVATLALTVRDLWGDLRSNHAGEAGAVMIYRGILAGSRDANVRRFAASHMATESEHLALMEALVPAAKRSLLLPVWKIAGWMTGFLSSLVGPRAVYASIEAVEVFVDRHYQQQIGKLAPTGASGALRSLLLSCQQDERHHRDEARVAQPGAAGTVRRLWARVVSLGSQAAVVLARRV